MPATVLCNDSSAFASRWSHNGPALAQCHCGLESTELNTLLRNNQGENAVVEVTDPYHPLYGRRFPIISISSGSCDARSVLVIDAAGKERQLRIPIQATNLVIRPQSIRTKITLAAITDLISTTGEVDIWKGQQTQCGDDYLPPDEARL
jgi:hypothetical protein